MTAQMIIVLCILVFVIVSLIVHKLPFGITGVIAIVALVVTGVTDMATAFSGLSSPTTIMVACMMVVASQLGKTSLVTKVKDQLNKLQGKRGFLLVLCIALIGILLSQLMGQMAAITIMLVFLQTLDDSSEASPARMLYMVVCINCLWVARFPVGIGATTPGLVNSLFEGIVGDRAAEYYVGIFDFCLAGLLPAIAGTIYCVLAYRLLPQSQIDSSNVRAMREMKPLSRKDDILIYIAFLACIFGFIFSDQIGSDLSNLIPAIGVLVLILSGTLSAKEAVATLTSDMIWMVAGISVLTTVIGRTGVGDLIGTGILHLLGSHPSALFVTVVFVVVTAIMTNFLSNYGTMAALIPIAASTALAGGMNVKSVVLAVAVTAWTTAFMMPTGSSAAIMGFGVGGYAPEKVLKFSLPLFILVIVTTIIGINIFFPIYG